MAERICVMNEAVQYYLTEAIKTHDSFGNGLLELSEEESNVAMGVLANTHLRFADELRSLLEKLKD